MKRCKTSRLGFTLVEIMIVVAIIGLLTAIAIPNFVKTRTLAQSRACINNLKQIESAKQVWGVEYGKAPSDTPAQSDLIGPLLYIRDMPKCPAGGVYEFNSIGLTPTCSSPGHTLEH
jgi:prepilin-type N-terminal cleavage/methylation domain-containing protein